MDKWGVVLNHGIFSILAPYTLPAASKDENSRTRRLLTLFGKHGRKLMRSRPCHAANISAEVALPEWLLRT
jgi:hypothetical protein